MNSANEVQESIKIALDAADAATDVTSEYNKIKSENKKLEASVKQIHKFTTIIFGLVWIDEMTIVSLIFTPIENIPVKSVIDFAPLFLLIIWMPLTLRESLITSPFNNLYFWFSWEKRQLFPKKKKINNKLTFFNNFLVLITLLN